MKASTAERQLQLGLGSFARGSQRREARRCGNAFANGRVYELPKGKHLLIDCRNVSRELCLSDELVLDVMARAARKAGAVVISQVRYQFGHNSPPGFTAVVMLDQSHCSAHTYADAGQIALDIFTCGDCEPEIVLSHIREELDLGDVTVQQLPRFSPTLNPEELTTAAF